MTDKQVCKMIAKLVKAYKEYKKACAEIEEKTNGEIIVCEPMESLHMYKGVEKIAELIGNEYVVIEKKGQYYDTELQTVLDGTIMYEIRHGDKKEEEDIDAVIKELLENER